MPRLNQSANTKNLLKKINISRQIQNKEQKHIQSYFLVYLEKNNLQYICKKRCNQT